MDIKNEQRQCVVIMSGDTSMRLSKKQIDRLTDILIKISQIPEYKELTCTVTI